MRRRRYRRWSLRLIGFIHGCFALCLLLLLGCRSVAFASLADGRRWLLVRRRPGRAPASRFVFCSLSLFFLLPRRPGAAASSPTLYTLLHTTQKIKKYPPVCTKFFEPQKKLDSRVSRRNERRRAVVSVPLVLVCGEENELIELLKRYYPYSSTLLHQQQL